MRYSIEFGIIFYAFKLNLEKGKIMFVIL